MDIADVKRKARTAASKRRAEAHELLKDTRAWRWPNAACPQGLASKAGIVSGFIPYKSEITNGSPDEPPAPQWLADLPSRRHRTGAAPGVPRLGAG